MFCEQTCSPCVCDEPDQRKPNVRHVRAQRWWMEPPAQRLRHSLALRPETPSSPQPGAAKDPIGPPSCQSIGKRCGTCPQMTSLTEAEPAQKFSDWHQRRAHPVRLQGSARPKQGWITPLSSVRKGKNSKRVKKERPSIITKSRHAKPLMTYRVIS